MNNIYDYFPFESFDDLKDKVRCGKAHIFINQRGSMSSVAQKESPIMTLLFWAGPIFGIAILFLFSKQYVGNYWLLLFSPVLILSSFWIVFSNLKFSLFTSLFLWIVPFIFQKSLWIAGIGLSSLIAIILYYVWYKQCQKIAVNAILNDEELFCILWNRTHITIVYNGNYYIASSKESFINFNKSISYCRYCGEKLDKDEEFCHKCGKKI